MTLDSFSIINLFNESTINLKLNDNKLIIVSENGSGKTTILRILYLFISKQWAKLSEYEFESIEANINKKSYSFSKKDFVIETFDQSIFNKISEEYPTYKSFINEILPKYGSNILKINNPILEDIENEHDVPKSLLLSIIDKLNNEVFDKEVYDWEVSVIYLPTYRRIERVFNDLFGDMEKTLEIHLKNIIPELNERIDSEKEENNGYSDTDEDLKKVFSDLWSSHSKEKWRKEKKDFIFLELTEFGMDDVNIKVSKILKSIEEGNVELNSSLDKFINCCNSYLTKNKKLKIKDKSRTLIIELKNSKKVNLNNLSSGEKQIVSIFCHLFLDINKPFIIFDEPELSLSLDWQEKILSDVLQSDIEGMIVATHSPFIITDELRKHAHGINEFIL
jgi:ABC-type lipoprotein export system ATPase subunit